MTIVLQPTPRGTVIRSVRKRAIEWLPAILIFVLAIVAWQGSIPC